MPDDKRPHIKELSRRELQRAAAKKILELPTGKPITFEDLIPNGVCQYCDKPVMALGLTGIKLWTCECRNVTQVRGGSRRCPWCSVPYLIITNVPNSGVTRDPELPACDCVDKRLMEHIEQLTATLLALDLRMDEMQWDQHIHAARESLGALMADVASRRKNHG